MIDAMPQRAALPEAHVVGRLNIDLFAVPARTPLSQAESFERSLGGFAGNVGTALARLGVRTSIISRVGDDGHGTFARDFLAAQGADTGYVSTDPYWPTPLAFLESWPPDRFPILYYRKPTAADLQITTVDLDVDRIAHTPLLFVSGTGFSAEPSAQTTFELMSAHRHTTVLDLDYRPALWADVSEYRAWMGRALPHANIVLGNLEEIEASGAAPSPEMTLVIKRGEAGSVIHHAGQSTEVPALKVDVANGLGAGDAFCAAFAYGLLRRRSLIDAAALGSVAGAIVASRTSCSTAMPYEAELNAALLDSELASLLDSTK
jgi:5-dehydro-2-deoxygluconokinase